MPIDIENSTHVKTSDTGTVEVIVRSPDGLVYNGWKQKVDSFVANWYRYEYYRRNPVPASIDLRNMDTGDETLNIERTRDIRGAVVNVLGFMTADKTGGYRSVILGSGQSPVGIDDYKLDTLIPHGTDPGQMVYKDASGLGMSLENREVTVVRSFDNFSGGSVTIRETGICSGLGVYTTLSNHALFVRDVLDVPVTVPDGYSVTVIYKLRRTTGLQFDLFYLFAAFRDSSFTIPSIRTTTNGTISYTSTGGWNTWGYLWSTHGYREPDNAGVFVGTGDKIVETTDFYLQNPIPLGTGPGTITRSSFGVQPLIIDTVNNQIRYTVNTTFTNLSDAAHHIHESVLVMTTQNHTASFTYNRLHGIVNRHVFESPVIFNVGRQDQINWHFEYSL